MAGRELGLPGRGDHRRKARLPPRAAFVGRWRACGCAWGGCCDVSYLDAQLREAGWEADSQALRYAKGSRPIKSRNLAIAEWPTASGPAVWEVAG